MDDAALVAAARTGDREAWGLMYERYADRLHDHCCSILRDQDAAAGALHDTFVEAAASMGRLGDPARLRAWLFGIARDVASRRHRSSAAAASGSEEAEFGTVRLDLGTDAGAPVDDLRRLVWDAAGGLSPDDRALLDLHLRHGLDGADLAEATGSTAADTGRKLGRLHELLERSFGALLVARTGSRACPELGALVSGWDGTLSPQLRERLAGHIDGCAICGDRKERLASPLALLAGVPLVHAPDALRPGILDDAVAAAASAPPAPEPPAPAPAPPPPPGSPPPTAPPVASVAGRSRWGWALGAAAAAVVVVAALLVGLAGDDDPDEVTAGGTSTTGASTTTSSSTTSTSSSTSSTTSSTTSTTAPPAPPPVLALSGQEVQLGASATQGTFAIVNSGGSPLSFVLTTSTALVRASPVTGAVDPGARRTITVRFDRAQASEGPFRHTVHIDADGAGTADAVVTGTVAADAPEILEATADPTTIETAPCNGGTTTATVTVRWNDASPATTVLSWSSTTNGADEIEPTTFEANEAVFTLGPFTHPDPALQWFVTVTDSLHASSSSAPETVEVLPC
jgi:DNA-directed RNA polymerase specialized sigma24 family protein